MAGKDYYPVIWLMKTTFFLGTEATGQLSRLVSFPFGRESRPILHERRVSLLALAHYNYRIISWGYRKQYSPVSPWGILWGYPWDTALGTYCHGSTLQLLCTTVSLNFSPPLRFLILDSEIIPQSKISKISVFSYLDTLMFPPHFTFPISADDYFPYQVWYLAGGINFPSEWLYVYLTTRYPFVLVVKYFKFHSCSSLCNTFCFSLPSASPTLM